MVQQITALPLRYQGVLFRSRLEADWAATLDNFGIAWEYEPEGYQLSDGTWYVPDFWLPGNEAWLEVKGSHNDRLMKTEQFAADLWSAHERDHRRAGPLVILGREPERVHHLFTEYPGGEWKWRWGLKTRWLGVRGRGLRSSVGLGACPDCDEYQFFALWPDHCFICGRTNPEQHDLWQRSYDMVASTVEFSRAPRP